MRITCPGCGVELELPSDAFGRHLRCDACGTKFEVNLSISRILQQPKIISKESTRPYDKKQLDDLAQSKGLKKFYRLFVLAPASIKFITAYIFCMFVLDLLNCIDGDKPTPAIVLFFLPCLPLLQRKEKAWRSLLVLCYFSFGAALLLAVLAVTSTAVSQIYNGALSLAITAAIAILPVYIALWRHTARQWACN